MSEPKNAPNQSAADSSGGCRTAPEERAPQSETKADPAPSVASAEGGKTERAGSRKVVNDLLGLSEKAKEFVDKLLKEGSTFEDVVEAANARGEAGITLNAVKAYFQGNRVLQTERALRQVEDAEALLASLDKDPKSAEARLARATFLTGYSRVNRNASVVTPREAARYRLECNNLNLKHQILVMQRKKAEADLEYSKARTALIKATGAKVQREILGLERELRARQAAGHPVGNDVVQKIQQLYGLACQPLLEEVVVSGGAKA